VQKAILSKSALQQKLSGDFEPSKKTTSPVPKADKKKKKKKKKNQERKLPDQDDKDGNLAPLPSEPHTRNPHT